MSGLAVRAAFQMSFSDWPQMFVGASAILEIDATLLTVRLLGWVSGLEETFRADLCQEPLHCCQPRSRRQRQWYGCGYANWRSALRTSKVRPKP